MQRHGVVGALHAHVDADGDRRQERRVGDALAGTRDALGPVGLRELLAVAGRAQVRVGCRVEREVERGVGEQRDRRVERAIQHLVQRARRGVAPLGRLGERLRGLGAVGAGAEHGIGGECALRERALERRHLRVDERHGARVDLGCARGGRVREVGELCVGGELARGTTQLGVLHRTIGARDALGGERLRRDERLREVQPRLLRERLRHAQVRRKPRRAQHLVERGVGRVHELAEVHHVLQARATRVERDRREEQRARLTHGVRRRGRVRRRGCVRRPLRAGGVCGGEDRQARSAEHPASAPPTIVMRHNTVK